MIPAIVTGGSTAGLMNYLVGPGRANEHESPHLVAGSEVIMRRWAAWEELSPAQGYEIAGFVDQYMNELGVKPVGAVRRFNREAGVVETVKDVACHVWHCSLSLSPEEGPLSEERWRAIAGDFMDEMGFTGADGKAPCRWVAVHHGQSKAGGDHVHIVANIVREDGTRWSAWQDQRRAQRAANVLEHRYGLQVIESREHQRGARADSQRDLRATQRRLKAGGERERGMEAATDRARLETRVRAAAASARDEADFIYRLRDLGVRVRARYAAGRTDVVVGYSVAMHSYDPSARTQWYGGGRLARDLALPRLRARWEDTPESAQRAVRAWNSARADDVITRAASRPVPVHGDVFQARASALRTWHETMRRIDPMDAVALADASRDVSALLACAGLSASPGHERDVLLRAARVAGRHAQTHTRHAPASPVARDVALAAQLLSLAASDARTSSMALVREVAALAESLALLHEQAGQTESARALLRQSAQVFAVVHSGDVPITAQEQAQARYDGLAATPAPAATDVLPSPRHEAGADLTPEHAARLRRVGALAMGGPLTASTPAGQDHRPSVPVPAATRGRTR